MPPKVVPPPRVENLAAKISDEGVWLSWSIPLSAKDGSKITGFDVFRYESADQSAFCPGCPIPFKEYIKIRLENPGPARVEGNRISYFDRRNSENYYLYKVVTRDERGLVSDGSNVVQVVPVKKADPEGGS